MAIEFELPEEAVRRLEAEAERRGTSIDDLITDLAAQLPAEGSGPGRRPAFVAIGASRTGTSHRIEEILADGFGRD